MDDEGVCSSPSCDRIYHVRPQITSLKPHEHNGIINLVIQTLIRSVIFLGISISNRGGTIKLIKLCENDLHFLLQLMESFLESNVFKLKFFESGSVFHLLDLTKGIRLTRDKSSGWD